MYLLFTALVTLLAVGPLILLTDWVTLLAVGPLILLTDWWVDAVDCF